MGESHNFFYFFDYFHLDKPIIHQNLNAKPTNMIFFNKNKAEKCPIFKIFFFKLAMINTYGVRENPINRNYTSQSELSI